MCLIANGATVTAADADADAGDADAEGAELCARALTVAMTGIRKTKANLTKVANVAGLL